MAISCYQCGSVLGSGRYCLRCGADVSVYRKIVRLSNRYYNIGLERARLRDLTGAVEALSRSLQIDKRNIQARNLLGLVLYEMGETVDALCEWVISTNYQTEDNPASGYVLELQNNRLELDTANQGIRKFNVALDHARHSNEDLAIIQLQWVLQQHPKMLKAHELMALLHIWAGDDAKAEKEAKYVLKIDRGSLFCQNILKELGNAPRSEAAKTISRMGDKARKALAAVQDENKRLSEATKGRPGFLLRFLLGLLILACAFFGIISPTVSRRKQTAVGDAVSLYAEKLEEARLEKADSEEKAAAYEVFLAMSRLDYVEDREKIEALFAELTPGGVDSQIYRELYDYWRDRLAPSETIAVSTEEGTEQETEAEPNND